MKKFLTLALVLATVLAVPALVSQAKPDFSGKWIQDMDKSDPMGGPGGGGRGPAGPQNLTITQTEPGIKGDTAQNATKPAVLETGHTVQVPLFVEQGDVIRVDTRTGQYIERVQK